MKQWTEMGKENISFFFTYVLIHIHILQNMENNERS